MPIIAANIICKFVNQFSFSQQSSLLMTAYAQKHDILKSIIIR